MRKALLVFTTLVFLIPHIIQARGISEDTAVGEQEAVCWAKQLFLSCDPYDPRNRYLPHFLREQIRWIAKEVAAQRLVLGVMLDKPDFTHGLLMSSGYDKWGIPVIHVSVKGLLSLTSRKKCAQSTVTRIQKHTFCTGLAHEVVHLKWSPASLLQQLQSPAEKLREEARVWTRIDQYVVTELLHKGEPVHPDLIRFHQVRKTCPATGECGAVLDFLEHRVQK